MNKILFCGPVGGKGNVGGGESGNNRTINIYKKNNYLVEVLPKPYPTGSGISSLIRYIFAMIFYISSFLKKVHSFKGNETVHLSAFYSHLVYLEFMLVIIAKIFRTPIVYELRAGGVKRFYEEGNFIYRYIFKFNITHADAVMSQGFDYKNYLEEKFKLKVFFYPNYVEKDFFESLNVIDNSYQAEVPEFEIVYLGRLVEAKNIEFILQVLHKLVSAGHNFKLNLIGPCQDIYKTRLKIFIDEKKLNNNVIFKGVITGPSLYNELRKSHFFLFPTKEPREGHSNSLTEAMACGLIPVVSNHGFNSYVVGNDSLVVDTYSVDGYYQKFINLIEGNEMQKLSLQMHERIKNNFLDTNVTKTLLDVDRLVRNKYEK